MSNLHEQEQDRLDDLWNALAHGARVRPADPTERLRADVIRGVHDADGTPRPDPRFLRDLRRSLMETSLDAASLGGPLPNHSPVPASESIGPYRPDAARRPRAIRRIFGGSTRLLEIAATIVLLLATLGLVASQDSLRGMLNLQEDETGDTAMYLGNAAHTGEMPGPGPTGDVGLLWRAPDESRVWAAYSSPVAADGIVYFATRHHDVRAGTVETQLAAIEVATGRYLWEVPLPGFLGNGHNLGPVVADGLVYIGVSTEEWLGGPPATPEAGATPEGVAHMAGSLIAFDAQTGEQAWSYDDLARAGDQAPVVAEGTAYVVAEDGTLHAVDAATGERRWTASISDDTTRGLASSPAVADGVVYVASNLGRLHAFDAANGDERWSAVIGGNQPTAAAVTGDTAYVVAYGGVPFDPYRTDPPDPILPEGTHRLYALDVASGQERWSIDVEGFQQSMGLTVAGDALLLTGVGSRGNDVAALAAADGQERWRAATDTGIVAPATWSGDTVYVGSFDSNLYALDLATGAVRWRVAAGGGILTPAYVADGVIFFVGDQNLYAVGSAAPGAGTPAATPAPDGDVSGLPPCDIEPRTELRRDEDGRWIVDVPAGATPPASIVPARASSEGSSNTIRWSELPTGEPAPAAVIDGIEATRAEMRACDRPGYETRLAAYYSDDFLRRHTFAASAPYEGYFFLTVPGSEYGAFESAIVLSDGRVAIVYRYSIHTTDPNDEDGLVDFGSLVVWTEQDGRWLIDEMAEISDCLNCG